MQIDEIKCRYINITDVLNLGVCNILFHYKFPFPLYENSTLVKSFLSTFSLRIRCCWDQASRKSLFYSVTWTLCGIWFMRPGILLLDDPIIHGFFPRPTADKSSSGRHSLMNSSYNSIRKTPCGSIASCHLRLCLQHVTPGHLNLFFFFFGRNRSSRRKSTSDIKTFSAGGGEGVDAYSNYSRTADVQHHCIDPWFLSRLIWCPRSTSIFGAWHDVRMSAVKCHG